MAPLVLDLPWLPTPPADLVARCRAAEDRADSPGPEIQRLAGHALGARDARAVTRAVRRCLASGTDLAPLSRLRLGILANSTYDLLLDWLPAAAARHGVALDTCAAPFDQVVQGALDPSSAINAARLDAVLVAVDHRWLDLDRPVPDDAAADRVSGAIGRLRSVVEGLRAHGGSAAILQTVPLPPVTLFGSFERRVRGTVRAMLEEANRAIGDLAAETGSTLLDVAALAERVGTDRWFDPVGWAAYKLPFSADAFPIYADTLGRLLGAIRGKARKCLVLDLDNTVWGGVIGDDGIGGLHLGQGSARGEAFLAVQRLAMELRDRGIMLAVCSKNDDAVARGPFRDHPDMLLREGHVSVFQANWLDKPSNLEAIARTLNIGLDSLVFLDDNPAERAQVRAALPVVAVPELPDDPAWYPWMLGSAGYFEAVTFSAEDRSRADSYAAEGQRAQVMATARDLGDYLTSLGMVMRFAPFEAAGRGRIAQLINKTNQFNLTTRRYAESEVAAMEGDASLLTVQARLSDRFGDLGMIGVIICRPAPGRSAIWDVDTWLMSCRVLGRRVEQAMLSKVVAEAASRGIARIVGTYVPTAKNGMVERHYADLGFHRTGGGEGTRSTWELDVASYVPPPLPMRIEDTPAAMPSEAGPARRAEALAV